MKKNIFSSESPPIFTCFPFLIVLTSLQDHSANPIPNALVASNNIQNNTKPIEITLNHNIDLKTNGNVDTNQIVMALKNTDVQQGMVGALKEAMYSNGLMAPTSNKTQLMNSNISASSLT